MVTRGLSLSLLCFSLTVATERRPNARATRPNSARQICECCTTNRSRATAVCPGWYTSSYSSAIRSGANTTAEHANMPAVSGEHANMPAGSTSCRFRNFSRGLSSLRQTSELSVAVAPVCSGCPTFTLTEILTEQSGVPLSTLHVLAPCSDSTIPRPMAYVLIHRLDAIGAIPRSCEESGKEKPRIYSEIDCCLRKVTQDTTPPHTPCAEFQSSTTPRRSR